LAKILEDLVSSGANVDVKELRSAVTRRKLQSGDGTVTVVYEVTLTVLCSPEEACAAAEQELLDTAGLASSDITSNVGSITALIEQEASEGAIAALSGFTGIDSITASDPVAIVTLRSFEPSSQPSLTPSKSAQPSSEPSPQPSSQPSSEYF